MRSQPQSKHQSRNHPIVGVKLSLQNASGDNAVRESVTKGDSPVAALDQRTDAYQTKASAYESNVPMLGNDHIPSSQSTLQPSGKKKKG